MTDLSNKRVAILSTHGFEEIELTSPKAVLEESGAEVHIIAPQPGSIRSTMPTPRIMMRWYCQEE